MAADRLLVFDDEPEFARLVRRVAEEVGYTVEVALRSAEFRRLYATFDPTVLVLDIVMPEADGIDTIRWLADRSPRAGLVIVSGFEPRYLTAAEHLARLKGIDVVAALTKPVEIARLRAVLRARIAAQKRA
jgi:DNA-binding response OmpR family regulator